MNFKAQKSENNFFTFILSNGDKIETNFNEIAYNGDDYVLAKNDFSNYYSLLNLDGEIIFPELNFLFRFQDGKLLAFENHYYEKESRDGVDLSKNYNVYKVFDFNSEKNVCLFEIETRSSKGEDARMVSFSPKKNGLIIKHLYKLFNKKIYSIGNVIFSDIFDDKWIIIADLGNIYFDKIQLEYKTHFVDMFFDIIKEKNIWSLVDISSIDDNSFFNENRIEKLNYHQLLDILIDKIEISLLSNPKAIESFSLDSKEFQNFEVIEILKNWNEQK